MVQACVKGDSSPLDVQPVIEVSLHPSAYAARDENNDWQLVIPDPTEAQVSEAIHPTAGTGALLNDGYVWWPWMFEDLDWNLAMFDGMDVHFHSVTSELENAIYINRVSIEAVIEVPEQVIL